MKKYILTIITRIVMLTKMEKTSIKKILKKIFVTASLFFAVNAYAQDDYVLKVHESNTLLQGDQLFLSHLNYNANQNKPGATISGNRRTRYAVHASYEFIQGITDNFELGFIVLTNFTNTYGYHLVGGHFRPKISCPDYWELPVGLSLSADIGLQNKDYFTSSLGLEIRPVIDHQFDNSYVSFNPTIGFSFEGNANESSPIFSPSGKYSFHFNELFDLGLEYYGNLNTLNAFKNTIEQKHTLLVVTDLKLDPDWVIHMGIGTGLNAASNKLVLQLMLGKKLNVFNKN